MTMDFRKPTAKKRLGAVLALALDGSRVEGVVLKRTNGSAQVLQRFAFTLSLDPLTAAPELVGRELRNHLDAAGVKERACVVGLPLRWALTAQTELPDLPEADVRSFLSIEAERAFPCETSSLLICESACAKVDGKTFVTMAGIPRNHLATLEAVLRTAKLKPASLTLATAALQPPADPASDGVLALLAGESQVGLQVTLHGGVAALRTLEGVIENQGGQSRLQADAVARETRITLGQLPAALREKVRTVRVFGPRNLAQQLADEIDLRLEPLGLRSEIVSQYPERPGGIALPAGTVVSPAVSLALGALSGPASGFEFLPPRVSAFQKSLGRYSSGRWRMAAAAAVVLGLLGGGLFGTQQFQLLRLNGQWDGMRVQVGELEQLNDRLRQFRPWNDDQMQVLSILRQVTLAFPEDSSVSAKSIEVRDLKTVNCSGVARDNPSLLKALDRLRASGGVSGLKVVQIRGKSPLQFTFDFQWTGRDEN